MKKILFGAVMASMLSFSVHAQEPAKVSTKEAFDYNRCSLSIINLAGMTANDKEAYNWTSTADFDGKFDMNDIKTKEIRVVNHKDSIKAVLMDQRVGKQVLDYWLQFDGKKFDQSLMEKRSRYNKTDADVLKDQASKVSTLNVADKTLFNNSYIMVTGLTKVKKNVDKKGRVSYDANAVAYVYKVNVNDSIIATIYENWLTEESTPEQIAQYENLDVDLELVAEVGKPGFDSDLQKAVNDAFQEELQPLENKIDKWQVVTSVYQKHPLGAKIGRKEGLKNCDRYAAFKVIENEQGELDYKKIGYVRATKVNDNRENAMGETECSNFYQISGHGLSEGMFLKQKKDNRSSISFAYNFMGYSMLQLDYDFLVHTSSTLGMMQYAGISIGFDLGDEQYIGSEYLGRDLYIPVSLNYGIGIHPIRWIEILPSVGFGADYCKNTAEMTAEEEDEDSFMKRCAYFGRAGLKVGFQVYYPVQLYIRADYSFTFSEGDFWRECSDHKRFKKFSIGAGVRVNF